MGAIADRLRAKRNAILNMAGKYRERDIAQSCQRIRKFGLIDHWMLTHGALFIHIPKAAGRSVQFALGMPIHQIAHLPAEAYRRADPQFFASAYKFCVVRNPWDRLVSSFHYMQSKPGQFNSLVKQTDLRSTPDFAIFLRELQRPLFRNQILTRMHFLPQSHFVCDSGEAILIDRIGRFEDLPGSFDFVSAPMRGEFRLEARNRGQHEDYRRYYRSDRDVELVGRMYETDCRLFGYGFEEL